MNKPPLPRYCVRWTDDVERVVHARTVADARDLARSLSKVPIHNIRRIFDSDQFPVQEAS